MFLKTNFKLKFEHDFDSPVWRLMITKPALLTVEERDPEKKDAFYHVFDLRTGNPLLKKFSAPDNFWSGIEAVEGHRVYFHGYKSAGLPYHKGIFVWDLDKGDFIWKNEELGWMFRNQDGIYAFRQKFESQDYFLLDPGSGEVLAELGGDSDKIHELAELESLKDDYSAYIYPENFVFSAWNTGGYLETLFPPDAIKSEAEVFSCNGIVFLNIHSGNPKDGFSNELLAVDPEKKKVLKRFTLNTRSKNMMAESCFIWNDLLFLMYGKKRIEVREIRK